MFIFIVVFSFPETDHWDFSRSICLYIIYMYVHMQIPDSVFNQTSSKFLDYSDK